MPSAFTDFTFAPFPANRFDRCLQALTQAVPGKYDGNIPPGIFDDRRRLADVRKVDGLNAGGEIERLPLVEHLLIQL